MQPHLLLPPTSDDKLAESAQHLAKWSLSETKTRHCVAEPRVRGLDRRETILGRLVAERAVGVATPSGVFRDVLGRGVTRCRPMVTRRFAPATGRNREPIRAVLARIVPDGSRILEVASGTGEHAAFLSRALPIRDWQPTELDPAALPGIDAWAKEEGAERMLPARELDVEAPWPFAPGSFDVILCVNMIHIAPWSCALALFKGASAQLERGGLLVLYGPYRVGGVPTAPSNEAFDRSLRARDARRGVRDLEAVIEAAAACELAHRETLSMPANNLIVVFGRS